MRFCQISHLCPMNTETYIQSVQKELHNYKTLADKAFMQIADEAFYREPDAESNSIAIIIRHLAGNMLSRWTDFYTADGEKDWRNRDDEFVEQTMSRAELLAFWEKGWHCCFHIIDNLQEEDLDKTVYIRTKPLVVIDAINRQIAHYAYHVGQIVYLCRMYRRGEWQSLSIPRNKSEEFNRKMGL